VTASDQPVFTMLAIAIICIGFVASFHFHWGLWHLARSRGQMPRSSAASSQPAGVDAADVAEQMLGSGCAGDVGVLLGEARVGEGVMGDIVELGSDAGCTEEGEKEVTPQEEEKTTLAEWFRKPELYTVTVLYMCSRLLLNISQVYLPLYLSGPSSALRLPKATIAQVPLVLYIASLAATPFLKAANLQLGRNVVMVLSLLLSGLCSFMWQVLPRVGEDGHGDVKGPLVSVLFVAAALGWSSSCAMVTSLSMAADVIGSKTASSAVIYGLLSFTDKLSSGIAIILVQSGDPCPNGAGESESASIGPAQCSRGGDYYRAVMTLVPGVSSLLGLLTLFLTDQLTRRKRRRRTAVKDEALLDGIENDISAPLLPDLDGEEGERAP
jgi:Na+/melibiose symporter-like transporter